MHQSVYLNGPQCYATFFRDPHGFMIEVVSPAPEATN
jgi:hypothetical protein